MPDDGKIHIALPSAEAATAERLAESFRQLTRDLAGAGFHAPFLTDALRVAATEAELLAHKGPDADAIIAPANAAWHDTVARTFNVGYVEAQPEFAGLVFEMISGKVVRVALHISDMRALGDRLQSDAKKLAALAVAKDGGK